MALRIALLLACLGLCSCSTAAEESKAPATQPVAPNAEGDSRLNHPADHPLRAVPYLIGLPSKEMQDQVRAGTALLGGCLVPPDQSTTASVCDQCRLWKRGEMKYWQALPKDFGVTATTKPATAPTAQ